MLLLWNPQFSPNHYENLSKCGTNGDLILTKFRNDWVKFVDFSIKAYFLMSTFFCIRPYIASIRCQTHYFEHPPPSSSKKKYTALHFCVSLWLSLSSPLRYQKWLRDRYFLLQLFIWLIYFSDKQHAHSIFYRKIQQHWFICFFIILYF